MAQTLLHTLKVQTHLSDPSHLIPHQAVRSKSALCVTVFTSCDSVEW